MTSDKKCHGCNGPINEDYTYITLRIIQPGKPDEDHYFGSVGCLGHVVVKEVADQIMEDIQRSFDARNN